MLLEMAGNQLTCRQTILFYLMFCLAVSSSAKEADENDDTDDEPEYNQPTVMIAILVRNKEHVLPWFLEYLDKLKYPKKRITLWIRSDHNKDDSVRMLKQWLAAVKDQYHSVDVQYQYDQEYADERGPCDWSNERFTNVMKLRQAALDNARKIWADYLFMIDADVVLENPQTLTLLMNEERAIVAPMLNASVGDTYSNFWGGMTDGGYYSRSDDYFDMVGRKLTGCFKVPMVHSAFLINMHHLLTEKIAYNPAPENYNGPYDDIIIFAYSVKAAGLSMYVLNTEYFGKVMIPLDYYNTLRDESDHFTFIKLETMVKRPPLRRSPYIDVEDPVADKMMFDEIYMINLVRRPERRQRMMEALKELGIQVTIFDAVDGRQLNNTYLDKLGVEMMDGYADPYAGRSLTMGEIGCFLSHFFIWKEILDKGYKSTLVLEDDVRFEPYFRTKLMRLLQEVEDRIPDWDLLYLGRKRLKISEESYVEGSETLVWPSYSYWTLSYILSNRGAKKLLQQEPLSKMIPVDEYLPIMFDKHPEGKWKEQFSPRDIVGLSAYPFLVYPTHYTGEQSYFSDTEDSVTILGEVNSEAVNLHNKKDEL
ncbi:procollagen galactosyltransferase 1-like isoform X2 [Mizuhopecten yessoensis]|uniref:Procollagen galactosyltransferase 1 n=1 Tax=Mizuhopecten yessoensis TaxID=6573 RepID=A0A210QLV5_MIZYE|nr:procollagen galactosyltransferase 1-like isoform X2 [Mizuhopecten yessoensis]OWF49716.1 Procollagen galactosyltransferase 1 [Mizuhopecten yessoensis]